MLPSENKLGREECAGWGVTTLQRPAPTPVPGAAAEGLSAPRASHAMSSLWAQEYRVLTEILLLQVAADRYHIEPEQPFRAWFQAGTWLSEDER